MATAILNTREYRQNGIQHSPNNLNDMIDSRSDGFQAYLGKIVIDTNTNIAYICLDYTTGNAVWKQIDLSDIP